MILTNSRVDKELRHLLASRISRSERVIEFHQELQVHVRSDVFDLIKDVYAEQGGQGSSPDRDTPFDDSFTYISFRRVAVVKQIANGK